MSTVTISLEQVSILEDSVCASRKAKKHANAFKCGCAHCRAWLVIENVRADMEAEAELHNPANWPDNVISLEDFRLRKEREKQENEEAI